MKKRIFLIGIILLLALTQVAFAKYTLSDSTSLEVYIDKTAPVINLVTKDKNETFSKSNLDDVEKNNSEVTINTSDNIKVEKNEYYYNPSENNFDNKEPSPFDSGKEFIDDGYYKIVTTDTSGNKTEIVILIDKTPPDVEVKFYKKGEESKIATMQTVLSTGKTKHLMADNIMEENESDIKTETVIDNEISQNTVPKRVAGARSVAYVSNEAELVSALANQVSLIYTRTSINVGANIYIGHTVTISAASNENALRFTGNGTFITLVGGSNLTVDRIVVDMGSYCRNKDAVGFNINSGASLSFTSNSIIDCGNNYGIIVNAGARATMHSSTILGGKKGITVKGSGILSFGDEGRNNEYWGNVTAISLENCTSTCSINQSNIKIRNNTNGIIKESGNGTLNITAGEIYSNSSNGVLLLSGTTNISGGTIYSNGNGVNLGRANLNLTGGTIRSNTTGILLSQNYSGKFKMTGGNIHSNTKYAINHSQAADGNCTIHGGSISGKVYLGLDDNYVNTNDKYPTFEVTPSKFFFKRKLVKTDSIECAKNEIEKVTLTKNGDWYKYNDDDEYIVVWRGCNVRVNYTDYFGNVIESELKTGNIGDSYETQEKELEGYDLIEIPDNQKGTFTEDDIIVTYKYDLKNIAVVKYEDLLSGVQSAKVWYNATSDNFTGEGTDFEKNKTFEDYGYYKIEVVNGVGLKKELKFTLNKDSLVR